ETVTIGVVVGEKAQKAALDWVQLKAPVTVMVPLETVKEGETRQPVPPERANVPVMSTVPPDNVIALEVVPLSSTLMFPVTENEALPLMFSAPPLFTSVSRYTATVPPVKLNAA